MNVKNGGHFEVHNHKYILKNNSKVNYGQIKYL